MLNNYGAFIRVNEQQIREHFARQYSEKVIAGMPEYRKYVMRKLQDSVLTIEDLIEDEQFCEGVVKSFFHEKLVEALGGWKAFLRLPTENMMGTKFTKEKYFSVKSRKIETEESVLITMCAGRPAIHFKLTTKDGYDYWVNYHARYMSYVDSVNTNWVIGTTYHRGPASKFWADTISDFPSTIEAYSLSKDYKQGYSWFKDIVSGKTFMDGFSDNTVEVSCSYFKKKLGFGDFIRLNEDTLRDIFATETRYMPEARAYVSNKLNNTYNIEHCINDNLFCENLVKRLFSPQIIDILGGWNKLLRLPVQAVEFYNPDVKYLQINHETMQSTEGACLTMCNGRPVLCVELCNEDGNYWINYHSRYNPKQYDFSAHWVMGNNSRYWAEKEPLLSKFSVKAITDLEDSPKYVKQGYAWLRDIVSGRKFTDQERQVSCPYFSRKLALIETAQASIRGYLARAGYTTYCNSKQKLQDLVAESKLDEVSDALAEAKAARDKLFKLTC